MKALFAVIAFTLGTLAEAQDSPPICPLTPEGRVWMQRALDGWAHARSELQLDARTLPWMIFFDAECAWHVAPDLVAAGSLSPLDDALHFDGNPVPILAAQNHNGRLALPGGQDAPVDRMAFTRPYEGAKETFFILALPDLWRQVWSAEDPPLEPFFLGVAMHELAHTYQLAELLRQVEAVGARAPLPSNLNDDIVETAFSGDPAYRALFERERDLLFAAVREMDDSRARTLARDALALARQRQARYFVGERRAFTELEGLFLNLEGIGSWIAYRMARYDPVHFSFEERVFSTSGRSTDWVQGEGLALVILIDRFLPDWQRRMLAPELASPFGLLEEALATRD